MSTFHHDAFAPEALNLSTDFEQALTNDAKANPRRVGSHVAVYEDADHGRFVAYGVIVNKKWDCFDREYIYEIQVSQGNSIIRAWSHLLRDMTPEECRMRFTTVRSYFDGLFA